MQESLQDGEDKGGDEKAEHPDLLPYSFLQLVQVLCHLCGKIGGGAGVVPGEVLSQDRLEEFQSNAKDLSFGCIVQAGHKGVASNPENESQSENFLGEFLYLVHEAGVQAGFQVEGRRKVANVDGGIFIQWHLSLVQVVVLVIVQAEQRRRHRHVVLSADRLVHKHLQDVTKSEWGTVVFNIFVLKTWSSVTNLTVMIGMTDPQPTAEAIPTKIKKMSRGEANANTLSTKDLKFELV